MKAAIRLALSLLVPAFLSGCITSAGGHLAPIAPSKPAAPPTIQYTVGDFEFTLEGGKMITSNKAGRILSDEIFKSWQKKGYISGFSYVESGKFDPSSQHRLTLSGSQYGESSILAQIFSGLTLLVIPYTVDTKYDIQYTLEMVDAGLRCSAEVADSYHTTIELLLMFAAPIAGRGQQQTMDAMGDHVFEQLARECGFGGSAVANKPGPASDALHEN